MCNGRENWAMERDPQDEDEQVSDNESSNHDEQVEPVSLPGGTRVHVLVQVNDDDIDQGRHADDEPPVVFFPYPPYVDMQRDCFDGFAVKPWTEEATGNDDAIVAEIRYHGTRRYLYNAVKNVLKRAHASKTAKAGHWNLFWGRHLESSQYTALLPGQKVNHFPGSLELGRKDRLCSNILRMQRKFGTFFQIIPETYVTGGKDGKPLMTAMSANPKSLWILKPPNQCCGRGIKLVAGGSDYKYEPDKRYVAQKYIMNPYLINGYKFDMRLYVLVLPQVTSFDPLRVYLFDNGLVRFCTQKYSTAKKDLKNRFGHLTNYSVNKKNKAFQSNQDAADDGAGSKWSYQALQAYFKTHGVDPDKIHADIALVISKTLMCVESPIVASLNSFKNVRQFDSCFELYGFDILLDATLRPWLLEVNVFPSMSSSSPMDKRIKSILVCDTFQLVGLPAVDMSQVHESHTKSRKERTLGLTKKLSTSTIQNEDASLGARWTLALEGETARQGHFRRIFPTEDTADHLPFFEKPRDGNLFYAKYIRNAKSNSKPLMSTTKPAAVVRRASFSDKLNQAKRTSLSYG
ncbi:Aste57867_24165 [Aphanomyces stellatus]|uniref:Tubulin--tyrosine ligase-like protein 5 n=1 Tax=Aphanomyces stellatus TaxID=120398 RepID=A0A485LPN9_9STRA|nr:hypothetical protein As57867_024091 [Aphanomyces stellatus]VFU00807.1 Aste57867_24165 [Aphanomyces stellatus]